MKRGYNLLAILDTKWQKHDRAAWRRKREIYSHSNFLHLPRPLMK